MPELPEVERAAKLLRSIAEGNNIVEVEAVEDTIVYSGTSHQEFAETLKGRSVKTVGRYGKVFYMELNGKGKVPVMHFGMTGMLQVKGQLATYYKETPKKASTDWPPRFMKFILHIKNKATGDITEVAFLDARRLGRIRLCESPLTDPPISSLGFDPILSMPGLDEFKGLVLKRSCPIKALLLDQSFSAGVGNWVAGTHIHSLLFHDLMHSEDEILYHSRIHPERRCNTLSEDELAALHHHTQEVCRVAVAVNADDTKFPSNWLFKHRWGKGKKKHTLTLPSGDPASIKWITVGGRTSAFVAELQHPAGGATKARRKGKSKETDATADEGEESELTSLEDEDAETDAPSKSSRKRKASDPGPGEEMRVARRKTKTELAVEAIKSEPVRRSRRHKT
ncbi:hypothetical protein BDW22DRAFT_1427726 [Trametopsis cervina]|nr:hypothetical protein BDW22DRAFT_1427726 [Trametopsis cervina]